jgi:hypothetical protein
MRPLAVLLAAALVSAPSSPVPADPPMTYRSMMASRAFRSLPSTYALTIWNCNDAQPETYPANTLRAPRWRLLAEVVDAHEGRHVSDAKAHPGGCVGVNLALRETEAKIQAETRAFCAGVYTGVRNGWYFNHAEGLMDAAMALSGAYSFGLTIASAHNRLAAVCPITSTGM